MPVHVTVQYADQPQIVAVRVICTHPNAYRVEPCCSPNQRIIECGCQGMPTVECPDCNDEIDEQTIERVLEGETE